MSTSKSKILNETESIEMLENRIAMLEKQYNDNKIKVNKLLKIKEIGIHLIHNKFHKIICFKVYNQIKVEFDQIDNYNNKFLKVILVINNYGVQL